MKVAIKIKIRKTINPIRNTSRTAPCCKLGLGKGQPEQHMNKCTCYNFEMFTRVIFFFFEADLEGNGTESNEKVA